MNLKVGTKTVAIAICSFIIGSSLVGSYYATVQVPKLNAQIRVLEQDVADQRRINRIIMSEKKSVIEKNHSLIKKLENSETQVQKLVTKLNYEKKYIKEEIVKSIDNSFEVTWYNDSGTTKSGRQTENGVTVAVDPNVIPLGSWIKIVFEDGTSLIRRADDTGGAVKGKVVDIYKKASTKTLLNMGRKFNVKVYIIEKQSE